VTERNTTECGFAITLPPLSDSEYYLFSVSATRDTVPVGSFTIHGPDFLGWDLRFTVK
jgi:hypothetical protein